MSDIKNLNDDTFEEHIKNNPLVVVDFWADWCAPCQMFASIFEDFANDNQEVSCVKVNIDEAHKTAEKYNVLSIPTIAIFKDGLLVDQQTGAIPKKLLQENLNKNK